MKKISCGSIKSSDERNLMRFISNPEPQKKSRFSFRTGSIRAKHPLHYKYLLRNLSNSTDGLLEISPKSARVINEQYHIIYADNQNIDRENRFISFTHVETRVSDSVKFSMISMVVPIHHSLCWGRRYCYRIVTNRATNETKSIVFCCKNQTERDYCIKEIRCTISDHLNSIIFEENMLNIGIQEARNLTQKNKYYCEIQLDGLIYARTSVKEMREMLFWGEEFDLTSLPSIKMVSITLWRLSRPKERYKDPQIVSHVNIPIENINRHCITEKWYSPSPVCLPNQVPKLAHNLTFSAACDINELPTSNQRVQNQVTDSAPILRAKSRYFPLKVLDSIYYIELIEFIKNNGVEILREMELEIKAKYREVLVSPMIQLSITENWVEDFLSELILKEAQSCDINLILRGNSMASKSIECFLKLECHGYLQNILQGTIKDIMFHNKDLEIDQSQLLKRNESISISAIRKRNLKLESVVDKVLMKIFSSVDIVPRRVRAVFSRIRTKLRNFGTLNLEFTQKVVSACFFLRLVCPAIMTPYLFHLLPEYSDDTSINRSFTLVAKCVQNIANFAGIDDTKENYMQQMALHCREYYGQMSEFIHSISNLNDDGITVHSINPVKEYHFAIDSARLCYYIEFYLSELASQKYTRLQEEIKQIIDRIKDNEKNISEGNDTIEKIKQNFELNDLGKTVVSTIESSGYFSTNDPHLGSVNSNLNHSPSSSVTALNNLKYSCPQFNNKHNNMMPISCPSVSDSNCNCINTNDNDPISLRKIVVLEKKRIQLLKKLVESLEFDDSTKPETIDLNPLNLSVNIEKLATSKHNVLKYIDFVNNNLNSFQLSQNVSSCDSLLRQFMKLNASLQSILIKNNSQANSNNSVNQGIAPI